MDGVNDGDPVGVGIYPTAWRIEVVDDDVHRGFGYVRYGIEDSHNLIYI